MGLLYNSAPLFAIVVAQAEAVVAPPMGLAVYGPLGLICLWLMWRDEKRSKDHEMTRGALTEVAHELRGLNLNWLMHNATHSPSEGIRALAQKELERKQTTGPTAK